jgi:hypothetical protein
VHDSPYEHVGVALPWDRAQQAKSGTKPHCAFSRQDILALTALTLSNLGIQHLHIFRCYEAQRIARKAAEMVDDAMPANHPLVVRILRVSDHPEGVERRKEEQRGKEREGGTWSEDESSRMAGATATLQLRRPHVWERIFHRAIYAASNCGTTTGSSNDNWIQFSLRNDSLHLRLDGKCVYTSCHALIPQHASHAPQIVTSPNP